VTDNQNNPMRIEEPKIQFIKKAVAEKIPGACVYLFGSRTNDQAKGGDIDILILSEQPADKRLLRSIRVGFYLQFGWQKLDIANFTYADNAVFKQIALENAIML
jgi:predicted nucleotidyltransferase